MRRRILNAVTLVEILVVISIAIIISALAFPALVSAKEASIRSSSMENLRQLHVALTLYRMDNGGDGRYGDYATMGLPPDLSHPSLKKWFAPSLWHSPCPNRHAGITKTATYNVFWSPEGTVGIQSWREYSQRRQGESVLVGDTNCSLPGDNWENYLLQHRAIGLYEAGNVRQFVKVGSPALADWWNENP